MIWRDDLSIVPLTAPALARGARPHWLGHVGVPDVEAAAAELVRHGAQPLGPTVRTPDGGAVAALKDPFGAILAVSTPVISTHPAPVVWHMHRGSARAGGSRSPR